MKLALQRKTDLALAALRALAAGPLSGTALAKAVKTTVGFLPQVMSSLVQEGWVVSLRGPGGGYQLTDSATSVHLLEVVEATEGPVGDGRCVMREGPCPGQPACSVHEVWLQAQQVLRQGFAEIPVLEGNSS
ncbi:MAG TPA: Rrf2 family transcriptional regulator [Acidimicrobiia bacterium]|nr:Rrf2 family transcriptional regulator [Acidimicrobiia bacterium]